MIIEYYFTDKFNLINKYPDPAGQQHAKIQEGVKKIFEKTGY